jgi:3-carboxy-cis,cis-muconate cycloisomerase
VTAGLELDAERMAQNLDATHGLILAEAVTMALAAHLGKQPAHALVEEACRTAVAGKRHLQAVLAEDSRVTAHLSAADLTRLLAPANYTGLAEKFIQRALAARAKP